MAREEYESGDMQTRWDFDPDEETANVTEFDPDEFASHEMVVDDLGFVVVDGCHTVTLLSFCELLKVLYDVPFTEERR